MTAFFFLNFYWYVFAVHNNHVGSWELIHVHDTFLFFIFHHPCILPESHSCISLINPCHVYRLKIRLLKRNIYIYKIYISISIYIIYIYQTYQTISQNTYKRWNTIVLSRSIPLDIFSMLSYNNFFLLLSVFYFIANLYMKFFIL